jgi:hypothetical protein
MTDMTETEAEALDYVSPEVSKKVATYIKLREFKARRAAVAAAEASEITAQMEIIETQLMTFLNQTGQRGGNTESGTFFKKVLTTSKVADRDVFMQFVKEEDMFNFLESRVNNTAVNEYIEANKRVPPGVSVARIEKLSINRPKTR